MSLRKRWIMHRLLQRQINKCMGPAQVPETLSALLKAVEDAYTAFEEDKAMTERSLELSSVELTQRNRQLLERNAQVQKLNDDLEARVAQRTTELRTSNQQLLDDIDQRKKIEEALRQAEEKF